MPTGLSINTTSSLVLDAAASPYPAASRAAAAQVDASGWYSCAAASPLGGGATGSRTNNARRPGSACSSPKTPQQAAAAQLKGLQRTPLPLILARMKVLLDRLNMLKEERQQQQQQQQQQQHGSTSCSTSATPAGSARASFFLDSSTEQAAALWLAQQQRHGNLDTAAFGHHRGSHAAATSSQHHKSSTVGCAGSSRPGTPGHNQARNGSATKKPAKKQLTEVSTSGGLSQSVMQRSAASIQDELEVTLGFISEFLASLRPDTRRALAAVARLESYKKDQLIYEIGDEPSHFYVVLSGRVELCSHPPGAPRPKSIVSVLRQGDAFGEQAIINGCQPHGTAASPATNVTLLVVSKQDFLSVLGSHFRDVAATWQHFLLSQVAPMADCDPGMVPRLCSSLVNEKPAAGQECSVHDDKVCFIRAGTFELRLVDLEAQQAAEAALAAAIASASSALPIAPIPPHLCHYAGHGGGCGGCGSSSRRPASAPSSGGGRQGRTGVGSNASSSAVTGSAAPAHPAGTSSTGSSSSSSSSQAAAKTVPAAAGGVAEGLQILQGQLANLPALGREGVLASVRVREGRLVGTQGLTKELRRQTQQCVPYKVIAELRAGSWFGGGAAILGSGRMQSALRVVAVGPACELVCADLSSLERHGGPPLIKSLRDDAAFKLTYCLGRLGVLQLGDAVGHPESALVVEAAAGAGAGAAAAGSQQLQAVASAGGGSIATGCGSVVMSASPGRSPCSTFRSIRPASAAAAGSAAARAERHEAGSSLAAKSAASTAAGLSRPASAERRPQSAARHSGKHEKGAGGTGGAAALRRSSSSGISSVSASSSTNTLDPSSIQPAAVPPPEHAAASDSTNLQPPTVFGTATSAAATGGGGNGGGGISSSSESVQAGSGFAAFRPSKPRQKRVHVPGSGVYSPGVMAALQHVQALQAADAFLSSPSSHAAAAAAAHSSSSESASADSQGPQGVTAAAGTAPSSARRTSICAPVTATAAAGVGGGILDAPCTSNRRPQTALPGHAVSSGSSGRVGGGRRPGSACVGGGTAADVYWQQPDHSSTATGTALSGLLSSLFTDGLKPLVREVDCLLSRTGAGQHIHPQQLQQQQQQHMQASGIQQLQHQRMSYMQQQQQPEELPSYAPQHQQQCWQRPSQRRPASAGGRLQAAAGVVGEGTHRSSLYSSGPGRQQESWAQQPSGREALVHKPAASLLAASVMWQRSSAAAFRPPLRQCLTTAEIAQLRSSAGGDGGRAVGSDWDDADDASS